MNIFKTILISLCCAFPCIGQKPIANLINNDGDSTGTAQFIQNDSGVKIIINLSKLPQGTHGIHIHQKGECQSPQFKSAGEHFNPYNNKHGFLNENGPHAGDLPNIEVSSEGNVQDTFITQRITLKKGKKNSILSKGGTSIIVHANPDDYISQPSGASGDRIACGVIIEVTEGNQK